MSKKDFFRGVEAATKANEAFMRKQAAATEELGKRVVQKIDEHGKIIDVILDTLNAQEKKELYDLQSAYDIADLGENEKEVLASFLLTLISKYNQDSENQKDYYFAVKKHLGVTDVSPDFDLSLVGNVDSRSELKAILQTVCEFLFLKTGDPSFLDEFEEEIGYFGLSRNVIREIIEPIERIYDALGLRGVVEHYIPAVKEESPNTEEKDTRVVLDWGDDKEFCLQNGISFTDIFSTREWSLNIQDHCFVRNFPSLRVTTAHLTDCIFENCGELTIEEGTAVHCVFAKIGTLFLDNTKVYDSVFQELHCDRGGMIISLEDSTISGCKFKDIQLEDDNYLGDGVGDCLVEKCSFERISTDRKDKELFICQDTVGKLIKRKREYDMVDRDSCTGLD